MHDVYYHGLAGDPLAVETDGKQHLPEAAGLGVEIDWDRMDDHTVETIVGPTW